MLNSTKLTREGYEGRMQPYYYILIIYFKIWIRTTAKIEKILKRPHTRCRVLKKLFANFLKEFLIIKENLNENQTEIPTSKYFF